MPSLGGDDAKPPSVSAGSPEGLAKELDNQSDFVPRRWDLSASLSSKGVYALV